MRALKLIVFAFSFMALVSGQVLSASAADKREKAWGDLKEEFFENVEISDGNALLSIEAPTRAHDAAVVPVKITAKPGAKFKRLVLFVDENPIPMAADFKFGKASPTASAFEASMRNTAKISSCGSRASRSTARRTSMDRATPISDF